MFVPAFVALMLQLFIFRDSPIHVRHCDRQPRTILLAFLVLTVVYGIVTVLAATVPGVGPLFQGSGAVLIAMWTLLVLAGSRQEKAEGFRRAGLQIGNVKLGRRFVLGVVLFLILQALLNAVTGLGDFQGRMGRLYGVPIPAGAYPLASIVFFSRLP